MSLSYKTKIELVKNRIGGYQKLVQALQGRGGEFARISKSTLYRWESAKSDEELPTRARKLIDDICRIFNAGQNELRIAHHGTPLALSTLLAYQDRNTRSRQRDDSKLKSPLAQLGIQGIHVPTANGWASLLSLHEGTADLAVASSGLLRRIRESYPDTECRRLCRVASSYMDAIATNRIYMHRHLREVDQFGYLDGTSLDDNIRQTLEQLNAFSPSRLHAYPDAKEAANDMVSTPRKFFCLVGGASWIAAVRRESEVLAEKRRKCYEVPGHLFGRFHFDAYVRPTHVEPTAIRAFLEAITKVNGDLMKRRSRLRAQALRDEYDLSALTAGEADIKAVKDHIASYEGHYEVSKLDLKTILSLWNREIYAPDER